PHAHPKIRLRLATFAKRTAGYSARASRPIPVLDRDRLVRLWVLWSSGPVEGDVLCVCRGWRPSRSARAVSPPPWPAPAQRHLVLFGHLFRYLQFLLQARPWPTWPSGPACSRPTACRPARRPLLTVRKPTRSRATCRAKSSELMTCPRCTPAA